MFFTSYIFFILLIITFGIYYLLKKSSYQIVLLILASLIFYAYHVPILVLLLIFSGSINVLSSYFTANQKGKKSKIIAITGVVLNLSVLGFFKYSPLISATLFAKNSSVGEFLLTIPLPIGISFFTFQGISLLVDVFTEKHFKNKDIISKSFLEHAGKTFLFIAFFPQLVAGPIVKAHDFLYQIRLKYISEIRWEPAIRNLVLGYFLKMVIADNLKEFTFWISYPYFQSQSTVTLITMLFGYSFQIFADFAGYSLIAIGVAGIFGYNLKDNFNFPYISTSFREFWKRWHISLSSFLMEYLYIPLGGNRKGKLRTYLNLLITMFLGGLWHGAAWSYAVWGLFHGFLLAIERLLVNTFKINPSRFILILKGIFVFCLVTLAWLLFKLPEFNHVIKYLESIRNNFYLKDNSKIITYILIYSFPVIIYHFRYLFKDYVWVIRKRRYDYLIYGVLFFLIIVNSGKPGAFIYFQF